MKNRLRLILIGLVALVFAGSFLSVSSAQKKMDGFSHLTPAHKKASDKSCNSCHTNPTPNWVAARGFPDDADFPGHVACFACHRSDFFAGNKPAICAGCHVSPGPRGVARFPFPMQSRPREFTTIFPHNVHQDIIASNINRSDVAVAHFVFASYRPDDTKPPQFSNCAICHQTPADLPKFAVRPPKTVGAPLVDATADSFVPTAGFFKNMPTGHASCFNCHFQGVRQPGVTPQVAGTDCASCHKFADKPYTASSVLPRYSLKFNHQDKDHVNKDCTVCHVRIAQNADVQNMKDADVPFMACAACHGDKLSEEMGKRAESITNKLPVFQCSYCHTPAIGRFPIPASHH